MTDIGDNEADDGPDVMPGVPDIEDDLPPDHDPENDLRNVKDGEQTVIIVDENGEPINQERTGLKAETLETKYLDDQFHEQIEAANERYQRSLGDVTAGAGLGATPDLVKAAEAMKHAVNQLLEHWNANRR